MGTLTQSAVALAARASDPKVKMIGLGADIEALSRALFEVRASLGVLALVALTKHYAPDGELSSETIAALNAMTAEAGIDRTVSILGAIYGSRGAGE